MSGALNYVGFVNQANNERTDDMPLNVLVAARAIDALDPGQLGTNGNGLPTYKGRLIGGMPDVTAVVGVPGVACRNAAAGESSGTVAMPIDGALAGRFMDGDVAAVAGPGLTIALDAVVALLNGPVSRTGMLTAYEISRIEIVLHVGGWCAPTASGTDGARYTNSANQAFAQAWTLLGGQFDGARSQYLKGQYAASAAATNASIANTAFWDGVVAALQAINQAPAAIVNTVADAVDATVEANVSKLSGKALMIFAVVGLVVIVVLVGPSFLRKELE